MKSKNRKLLIIGIIVGVIVIIALSILIYSLLSASSHKTKDSVIGKWQVQNQVLKDDNIYELITFTKQGKIIISISGDNHDNTVVGDYSIVSEGVLTITINGESESTQFSFMGNNDNLIIETTSTILTVPAPSVDTLLMLKRLA